MKKHKKTPEELQEEYRREVLNNKKDCPNLYDLEIRKNKYKFKHTP